uniref:Polyketide synthase n=1 Tax=Peronospora matthiolae TaxID=2874970 RepID=A0AAV1UUR2_9STRA
MLGVPSSDRPTDSVTASDHCSVQIREQPDPWASRMVVTTAFHAEKQPFSTPCVA